MAKRKSRSLRDRYVEVLQDLETFDGTTVPAGTIMRVRKVFNGLELGMTKICPCCGIGFGKVIRRVPHYKVKVLECEPSPAQKVIQLPGFNPEL